MEETIKTITNIPLKGNFTANGKNYYIEENLTLNRWLVMQELQIELGFGIEYSEMQRNWLKIFNLCNEMKFGEIAVMSHNMVHAIKPLYSKEPLLLKFCSLYINTADENRAEITEMQITEKINDWKAEGLGIDGFFAFSLSKVNSLAENYKKAIHKDLQEEMQKM